MYLIIRYAFPAAPIFRLSPTTQKLITFGESGKTLSLPMEIASELPFCLGDGIRPST